MIIKVYYTDGSTYITDDKEVTVRTDDLSVQQAMQLAFDTLSLFEIDVWADQWVLRQSIKAFKNITKTKTFLDYYNDLALHIFNDNILRGFRFDITDGIPQLFDTLLKQEYEYGYKDIDNDLIKLYVRDYIADSLDNYMSKSNRTNQEKKIAKKYYKLFRDTEVKFCDIQHQIFCDNENLHQSIQNTKIMFEAIHDLCKFCITTENIDIWNEIYTFVRDKTQKIIDYDNECDKRDIIKEFEDDRWVTDYIEEV